MASVFSFPTQSPPWLICSHRQMLQKLAALAPPKYATPVSYHSLLSPCQSPFSSAIVVARARPPTFGVMHGTATFGFPTIRRSLHPPLLHVVMHLLRRRVVMHLLRALTRIACLHTIALSSQRLARMVDRTALLMLRQAFSCRNSIGWCLTALLIPQSLASFLLPP